AGGVPDVDHQQLAVVVRGGELLAVVGGAGELQRLAAIVGRDLGADPVAGHVAGLVAITGVTTAGGEKCGGCHCTGRTEQAPTAGACVHAHVSLPPVASTAPAYSAAAGSA